MLRIALPNKGRLSDDILRLFADAGLELQTRPSRALSAKIGDAFEVIFVRAQDIPEFVADGAAHVGVTGKDLVVESKRDLDELLDLRFGKARLVIAAREDSGVQKIEDLKDGMRVATSFQTATQAFFDELGIKVDIVQVSGAAEIAPHLGIADIISDLTSTGSTLKTNGLKEIATVLESSARLLCRKDLSPEEKGEAEELTVALTSVLNARNQRYLMANIPRRALEMARQILPGINGPTVVDVLDNQNLVAVHAVVPIDAVYRVVSQIRGLGGTGILVTRIERLLP